MRMLPAPPAPRPRPGPLGLLLLALALAGASCRSVPAAPAARPAEGVPSLVVVISVDQLRADYLRRFAAGFGQDGFARLARGASYEARYPYAATFTGPGHASIGTGLPPAENGIVGNGWLERGPHAAEHPTMTYCVADARARPVTEAGGRLAVLADVASSSPVNLSGDALGDRVRERYPSARVIGVSLKDRAAILMAGRKATAAYWLDERSARFESSTYYAGASPAVLAFHPSCLTAGGADFARCPHRRWSPRAHLGAALSRMDVFDTEATERFEIVPRGLRRRGPDDYDVEDLRGLVSTPFGNEILLDFARHVIEAEHLGARGVPDVLFVSLSSLDLIGHRFGPDSVEVADAVVSLDAQLAQFIDFVVDRVGAPRVTFALTSDHGIQSIPAVARARRPGADVGEVDLAGIVERIEARLRGPGASRTAAAGRPVVVFEEPAFWIDWARLAELGLGGADPEQVRRAVRDVVARVPGVSGAWTSSELLAPCSPAPAGAPAEQSALARCRAVQLSFRADRSGDVLVTLREGWIWKPGRAHGAPAYATTHGQPVDADALVPLLFWGAGIRPGAGPASDASPLDLATTLGAVLGVEAGRAGARPLPCVKPAPPAR